MKYSVFVYVSVVCALTRALPVQIETGEEWLGGFVGGQVGGYQETTTSGTPQSSTAITTTDQSTTGFVDSYSAYSDLVSYSDLSYDWSSWYDQSEQQEVVNDT